MKEVIHVTITMLNIILGQCFRSDMMYQQCGSTIESRSGEVIFDATKLPVTVRTCHITIGSNPNNVLATNRLLLYFTDIKLQDDCNKNMLKVSEITNTSLPPEKGITMLICGYSASSVKKGTILISSGRSIDVTFTRNVPSYEQSSAYFSFKYSSFHKGVCDVNNEVECLQENVGNICVKKDIVCARRVEVCKGFIYSTCFQKLEDTKSLEYLKYILCALLGIFMLFGIKFFYRQYRKGRSDGTCLSRIKQRIVRDDQETSNEHTFTVENYSALRESVPNIFYNNEGETNIVDTTVSADNNAIVQIATSPSPSAPTLEEMGYETHASLEREIPASLPPSYEESVVPSYAEVMSHKDKWFQSQANTTAASSQKIQETNTEHTIRIPPKKDIWKWLILIKGYSTDDVNHE